MTDNCTAWAQAGRGFAERYLVACQKAAGHDGKHHDPDRDIEWTDEETDHA